jgi:hypothetical protein
VLTVKVEDKEVTPVVRSRVPCPKAQVGVFAPLGETEQERFTMPVKPPVEATVMFDVPLEPAATVILPLLVSERPGVAVVLPLTAAVMLSV